ncbi:MAG: DUF3794 domain-containing protein [Defluviitaleaceae bacterium]|nr:DUF3794 domain-containing protein [Defluviitaleaceae bacterium]
MAELVREQVFLDQSVGSEQVQVMLEGDLIVPDTKPDMALLLQTEEQVIIDRTEAGADRVNYVGRLNLSVLYVAKSADKSVHAISLSRPLDDFINLDGVSKDMWVRAKASIANIDYRVVNDRKVNYRAIVNVSMTAERSDAHEMVVHINDVPENQLLKSDLNLNRTIENRIDRFVVKEQLVLPSSKPNIREILQVTAGVTNQEMRISSGRVNLSGELSLTTLYRGDNEESFIDFIESELPFNGPIDIAGAREDMFADVVLQVLDHHVSIRPDDDGEDRILEVEISVGVEMKVYSSETFPILEDAYIINQQLSLTKTAVKYPRLVCLNRNQTPVKEVVTLSGTAPSIPDMLQVFRVKGNAHIDDIKVIEDKIVVEGAINTDILYVAESDTTPLSSFKTVIPYRQVIEAKGADPSMSVDVDISIDHVTFNMLAPRETEVRFLLTFNTRVVEQEETRIIRDIDFSEIDHATLASQASMTVYIVQNDDNLWKIAKRYNTPLDELLSVNDIEHPGKVTAGQKLLILKRGI